MEIFGLDFYPFTHGALLFIIVRKLCSILKFFEWVKQVETRVAKNWTIKKILQLFQTKLIDSTILAAVWGLVIWHQHFGNPVTTDIRKTSSSYTILCAVPTEITSCSEKSSTVTILAAKMSTLTEFTISGASAGPIYILNII